jgi:hypothetical protein
MRLGERAIAAGLPACNTDGMESVESASRSPSLSLRRMLRRESRNSWAVVVWFMMIATLVALTLILGVATRTEGLLCVGFMLVVLLFTLAIPMGMFSGLNDAVTTWQQIHYTLDSLGDADVLLYQIDRELAAEDVEIFGAIPERFRRQTRGTLVVTNAWILWFGWNEFRIFPISRIVWLYKRLEVSSAWWRVTDHRRVELACVTRANTLLTMRISCEEFADDAIEFLFRKRPEALYGFRAEWMHLAEESIEPVLKEVACRLVVWEQLSHEERAEWRNDCLADARHFVRRVDSMTAQSTSNY